jgi:hypothetical protein
MYPYGLSHSCTAPSGTSEGKTGGGTRKDGGLKVGQGLIMLAGLMGLMLQSYMHANVVHGQPSRSA